MSAVRVAAFEQVVRRFYEAAAIPQLWPVALQDLAEAVGAQGAAAHASDGVRTFRTIVSDGAGSLYDDFVRHWQKPELNSHRARGMALIRKGWRGALTERDCFSAEELARDPFHQEFIVPAGFTSFVGTIVAQGSGMVLSTSIYRRQSQGAYERDEVRLINELAARLRAAGDFALQVGLRSASGLVDAQAAGGRAVALIGHDGRVLHMSERFEGVIGNGLYVRAGRLGACDAAADQAIAAGLAPLGAPELTQKPCACVVVPRPDGSRPLIVQIFPLVGAAQDILHLVSALVTVTDLEAANLKPAERLLAQAFGLTAAEARLAGQLAAGGTLPEIAGTDGVAYDTLRCHLKAIFVKTGTGRQSELMLLLSKFIGLPACDDGLPEETRGAKRRGRRLS